MEPLSAHEFIHIDDIIEHEEIDIKEIVDVVLGKGLENESNDEDESEISIGEALNSAKTLITFIKQSEWGVDVNFYHNLVKLEREIIVKSIAEKKQTSIDQFFISDEF
jgi:hypothetical protein